MSFVSVADWMLLCHNMFSDFFNKYSEPMTDSQVRAIQILRKGLMDELNASDDLLNKLRHICIHDKHRNRILRESSMDERVSKLLDIMQRRSQGDFEDFIRRLYESGQPDVARLLETVSGKLFDTHDTSWLSHPAEPAFNYLIYAVLLKGLATSDMIRSSANVVLYETLPTAFHKNALSLFVDSPQQPLQNAVLIFPETTLGLVRNFKR